MNQRSFLTCGLKFLVALVVSNIEVVNLPITRGHHLAGGAVGLIHADFLWQGLANGEVNRAIGDISPGITLWYNTFVFCKSYIPVPGAVACK